MPLYEYQCEQCGITFEVIQKFSDDPVQACRSCGGPVRRLLSAPAIQFKGSGWYITDYARKGAGGSDGEKPAAAETASAPASGTETKSTNTTSSTSTATSADKK